MNMHVDSINDYDGHRFWRMCQITLCLQYVMSGGHSGTVRWLTHTNTFLIFPDGAFGGKNYINGSLDASRRDTSIAVIGIANRVGIKKHPFRIRAIKPMKKTCSQALPRPFRYFLFPLTYQSILHSIHTGMDSKVLCAVHTVWSELKNAASSNTGVPPLSWRVHRLVEPVAIIVSSPH